MQGSILDKESYAGHSEQIMRKAPAVHDRLNCRSYQHGVGKAPEPAQQVLLCTVPDYGIAQSDTGKQEKYIHAEIAHL